MKSKKTEFAVAMPRPEPDWEARQALETISRAEEHKKNPHIMKRVRKLAMEQHKAVMKPMRAPRGAVPAAKPAMMKPARRK